MRIKDQNLWQAQKAEIAQSETKEIGELFLMFVEVWCDRAQVLLDDEPHLGHNLRPIDGLRRTLSAVESDLGMLPPGWVSQMLLVIAANWDCNQSEDDFFGSLTPIERHAVGDAATLIQHRMTQGV